MALRKINPTTTKSWQKLTAHFKAIQDERLQDYFNQDDKRFDRFSIKWEDFLVDFSKNRIQQETLVLLEDFAHEMGLKEAMDAYFAGEAINQTEGRAVLHTALRAPEATQIYLDGLDVMPEVHAIKAKIRSFCNNCLLYTSPSPRDGLLSRMPSSA